MYAFSFLFPPDKIEEAQKELNGAEVSKKGKKPALCGLGSCRDAHMDLSELKPFFRKLVLMCVDLGSLSTSPHTISLSSPCPDAGNVRNRCSAFESTAGPCHVVDSVDTMTLMCVPVR